MTAGHRGHVVSVNVGAVRAVTWHGRTVHTGIWKSPVGAAAVAVRGVNLDGDDQADRTVHGGVDKAVYAYAEEDYQWWADEQQLPVAPGLFGENLTVRGLALRDAVVGERWAVGSVVLTVRQPRLPCFKLAVRLDDPQFPKRFLAAGRAGAYLRIDTPGEVRAGDAVHVIDRPAHGVTLAHMLDAMRDPRLASALLAVPALPEFWRRYASGEEG